MKITVLLKEVPDTYGERTLDATSGLTNRSSLAPTIDEITERALEVALSYRDSHPDTTVTVLTMGPNSAGASVRKALATGADSAVLVADDRCSGADIQATGEILAAALRRIEPDLVIAGDVSTDGSGGVVAAVIAERLEYPHLTSLESVSFTTSEVTGVRSGELETLTVSATLPAIVSVTEALPEARFASFKGVVAAKKKTIETLNLDDLGIDIEAETTAHSIMLSVAERPARTRGTLVVDDGTAASSLVDFLTYERLI